MKEKETRIEFGEAASKAMEREKDLYCYPADLRHAFSERQLICANKLDDCFRVDDDNDHYWGKAVINNTHLQKLYKNLRRNDNTFRLEPGERYTISLNVPDKEWRIYMGHKSDDDYHFRTNLPYRNWPVVVIPSKKPVNFIAKRIILENVRFDEKYKKVLQDYPVELLLCSGTELLQDYIDKALDYKKRDEFSSMIEDYDDVYLNEDGNVDYNKLE